MNKLYFGDNLDVLREQIADASVDLVYLDPPFNSKRDYNLLFKTPKGHDSDAQITAFEDSWHWGEQAEREFGQIMKCGNSDVAELLRALRAFLKENDMLAYLTMMASRLLELHRALKPTGSLYLHCDPTASHYLKLVLDAVFGSKNYRAEISWKRAAAHNDAKQGRKIYGSVRDVILFYTKSSEWTWNWIYRPYDEEYARTGYRYDDGDGRKYGKHDLTAAKGGGDTDYAWHVKRPLDGQWSADLNDDWKQPKDGWEYSTAKPYGRKHWAYSKDNMRKFEAEGRIAYSRTGMPLYKRYLDEMKGLTVDNNWVDIPPVRGNESLGYPTQKPLALLERIISASSNPGDVVLDPFCGCGTAVHAAEQLGRRWIGIDITHLAVSLIEKRLREAFPGIVFSVEGTPRDAGAAANLADRDKHQFQLWAVSLVGAQPYKGGKKGADSGIDGLIFPQVGKSDTAKVVISVKGGQNVSVQMVRDLKGVLDREKADIGLFITLATPTKPMLTEAAAAGLYESPHHGSFPRLQLLTIEELLTGKRPQFPDLSLGDSTLKKAQRTHKVQDSGALFD